MSTEAGQAGQIDISPLATETLRVPLVGTAPLIVHRFSEKEKRHLLDTFQNKPNPKQPKDPEAEYDSAFYRHDDGGYGFPVIAFKCATVGAARFYGKAIPMTTMRQIMFFDAEFSKANGQKLVRITGTPHMREDVTRVARGGTDLRYRPEFMEWSTLVTVTYVKSMIDRSSVLRMMNAGGMGVGIGEWRIEKGGEFGTYEVDPTRDIEVL